MLYRGEKIGDVNKKRHDFLGATTEVAALKKALSEAEDKAAKEHTEREKQEARVEEVLKELRALVKKHKSLELDSKMQASEGGRGQLR